jgi:hypothetical protein
VLVAMTTIAAVALPRLASVDLRLVLLSERRKPRRYLLRHDTNDTHDAMMGVGERCPQSSQDRRKDELRDE